MTHSVNTFRIVEVLLLETRREDGLLHSDDTYPIDGLLRVETKRER
jgi:hypothetical protein